MEGYTGQEKEGDGSEGKGSSPIFEILKNTLV